MKKATFAIPTDRCDDCGQTRPAFGFVRVVIDGREYSWEEFGEFLSCFNGFDFRLECFDACEGREITPDPARPNPLWWLPDVEGTDSDDRRHH
jgi:hypothetical protein